MRLAIYRQELHMIGIPSLIWLGGLLALATLYLSIYPTFARDADTVTHVFAKLPDAVKQAMGTGGFTLLSFPGFFANILPIFILVSGIEALYMGIMMTNREQLAHTNDFLLAKPIGRSRIFWQKLTANLSVLALTSGILIGAIFAGSSIVHAASFSHLTLLMVLIVVSGTQLWFFALGTFLAQVLGRIRGAIGVSIGIVFGLFITSMLGPVIGDKLVRVITPFKYIDLAAVVSTQTYQWSHVVLWAGIVIVCIGTSLVIYTKRDVRA